MKVIVNEDCIGCGVCENVCPQVFKVNESGVSQVVGTGNQTEILEAALACPVNAIEVE